MGLPLSVVLWSGSGKGKEKKTTIFISDFYFWKSQGNFDLITRKMTYYYQEITRKLPDFDLEFGSSLLTTHHSLIKRCARMARNLYITRV
jgi:hypothetical protein